MSVTDAQFWKQRIDESTQIGNLRYSVYSTTQEDWNAINYYHQKIVKELCQGRVLDAGCAYGRASEWIDDYTGVDVSPDFIELAKEKYPDKKFLVSDLKELPFGDKEFDWAVCISIKAMLEREIPGEWEKVLEELKRVAKKILILEYSYRDKYEII